MKTNEFYNPRLDGLRAIAVLLVFLLHWRPFDFLGESVADLSSVGWVGVDLFFALSGYLITELLLREKEKFGNISLRYFWIRRALRIWPLYYLAVFLLLYIVPNFPGLHLASPDPINAVDRYYISQQLIPASVLYWVNIKMALATDFKNVSTILWSVAFEEQFYLVWPLLVMTLSQTRLVIAACAFILIALFCRGWGLAYAASPKAFLSFFPLARLDAIAFGALVALAFRNESFRLYAKKYSYVLSIAALVSLYIGLFAIPNMSEMPDYNGIFDPNIWKMFFVGLGCAALVASLTSGGTFTSFFSLRPLVALGKRSYAAYLFHMPCIWAGFAIGVQLHIRGVALRVATFLFGVSITFIVAALSYRFFERPFLKAKATFNR